MLLFDFEQTDAELGRCGHRCPSGRIPTVGD
jgi:hypothetical protein